ncbi:MAG: adenylate/guanylate cyclase domain-containing protein [Burkholderiaceae bacterium]|jgi:adenylate cyclase|nr:adenylate/guanylate cyclase domain-containing protein [Burkholderiaceae bacterium]
MSSLPTFWRDHPWRLRTAALGLAAVVVGIVQALVPQVLRRVEAVAGDAAWRVAVTRIPERRLVVVDIDEVSLDRHGAWPWPRPTLAALSRRLQDAGVAVQAIDLVLDAARPGDEQLLELWRHSPVVLGQIFSLDPEATPRVGHVVGPVTVVPGSAGLPDTKRGACPPFAPLSHGYIGNAGTLVSAGSVAGHLTPSVHADGVVRELPALICHEGRAYPSLALAALWRAAQPDGALTSSPDWTWRAGVGLFEPAYVITSPSLPGVRVPVDAAGNLRVPFRVARGALTSVSAHQVLAGQAPQEILAGTVALVGATAFGIGDLAATPLASVAAGVEVHAELLLGLLDQRVPYTPRHAAIGQGLAMLLIAGGLWLVAVRRRGVPAKRLPIAGVVMAAMCAAAAYGALMGADQWWPWAGPALYALLAASALATAEHALARAQRERLASHLGAYLPAPVARRLMASDPSGQLQVQRRPVSVLVADIRNFSAFAQHRPPEETAALLHAFYCVAVDIVEQHGGVVEQIAGDSVLAVWNAYADCHEHPQRALQAAKALLRETRSLLARRPDPAHGQLVQALALGIGLECGLAVVGSFGPARRRSHAALGEPVSVASRLQKMTQDLSMPLLIGPQMAPQLPQQSTESLGDFLLEGLSRPYRLYGAADFADLGSPEDPWVSMPPRGAGDTADEPWPDGRAVKQGLAVVAASTVAVSQHTNKPTHDA